MQSRFRPENDLCSSARNRETRPVRRATTALTRRFHWLPQIMVTCLLFAGSVLAGEPLIRHEEPIEFRAGELEWSVFGLGGFGENDERVNEERTEEISRTITEARFVYVPVTITTYK